MTVGMRAQNSRRRTALVAAVLAVPVSTTALWAASASAAPAPPPVTGTVPGAPSGVVATPGDHQAVVRFTRPGSAGSTPITSYRVRAVDQTSAARGGESAVSSGSVTKAPATVATVPGLTDGDSYTFTVTAANSIGTGPASQPSKAVVPSSADPIVAHYDSLGGAHSLLGSAVGVEYAVAGGRAQNYQYGRIYFSARTGAYSVHGAILTHYLQLAGPAGVLGFPVSDERSVGSTGRANAFDGADRDGGAILFTARTGAYSVHGEILRHYLRLGGAGSVLGYPTSDELGTPDRAGRGNTFTGGVMLWTPRLGAHEVHGAILVRYAQLKFESGPLGYPVTDEYAVAGGRRSDFVGGIVVYKFATRTTTVTLH